VAYLTYKLEAGLFSAYVDGRRSNISLNKSLLLLMWTDSGSLVTICGLMRTKKFQDPHISVTGLG